MQTPWRNLEENVIFMPRIGVGKVLWVISSRTGCLWLSGGRPYLVTRFPTRDKKETGESKC